MFQDNLTLGVVIAMAFISLCVGAALYFTRKLIAEDKILFILVFMVILLSATWCVDKIVASKTQLLNDEENKSVLQMMDNVISLVIGYWLRGKQNKTDA